MFFSKIKGTTYDECSSNAVLKTCPQMNDESENTWSCGISERKRDGYVSWVQMGCRQTKQCQREWCWVQNFTFAYTQVHKPSFRP